MKRFLLFIPFLMLSFGLAAQNGGGMTSTFFKIHLNPADADAVIYYGPTETDINSLFTPVGGGNYETEDLDFGRYWYKVVSEMYEEEVGYVDLCESTDVRQIELKPRFSYLDVNITPSDAIVLVDGKPYTLQTKYSRGLHSIVATRSGYLAYFGTVDMPGNGERFSQNIVMRSNQGTVICLCDDPEADLYIDGKWIGKSGTSCNVKGGVEYVLDARRIGFEIMSVPFSVNAEETKSVTVPSPVELFGVLTILSTPPGANVVIDGSVVGTTSFKKRMRAGSYNITLEKEGYLAKTGTVSVIPNDMVKYSEVLEEAPLQALVDIHTDEDAKLTIDGVQLNATGYWVGFLDAGEHVLNSVKDGCIPGELWVSIDDAEPKQFTVPNPIEIEEVEEEEIEEEAIPFQLVETKPSFFGGDANAFSQWVNERLVYPEIAKENGVQGRVLLQFTIDRTGRVTNVKVVRGVDASLDKEAVRVVSSSPYWTPGMQRNRPVNVTYTFPVIFQLR